MTTKTNLCPLTDECQPKYIPLMTQMIPNQNRSHIGTEPNVGYEACQVCKNDERCVPHMQEKGFPVCESGNGSASGCYDIPTGHQRSCECKDCACKRVAVLEADCPQHVEGNRWQDLSRKFRDPEVQEIHERLKSSEGAKQLLRWEVDDEQLPCVLRRFRNSNTGYVGQAKVHYGAAQDCDYPKPLVHGVAQFDSIPGGKVISPPPKTWVQQLDVDLAESIYASNKLRPIGSSHNQLDNLPIQINYETTFGIKSHHDIKAGDLVNPKKDRHFVQAEHECCRHLYRKTHSNFEPGEQACRNYVGGFNRSGTFGDLTPHDNAGRPCAMVIGNWRKCNSDPPIVSKVYADHLDQRIPKLGVAQDRLCGFRDRGVEFVYGKSTLTENETQLSDVIFNRCPNEGAKKSKKIMQSLKEWVIKIRHNFKSDRGADLEALYEEFYANDKECNGTIEWAPFMRCLIEQRVPRTMEPLEFMEALAYIQIFHPLPCNKVDYHLLMDFIKGHEDPKFLAKVTTLNPYYLPHTNSCIHFRTTYSDLTANMCTEQSCIQWAKEQRVNGMPSIRKDKMPGLVRSTSDRNNYGDDGNAYSLIWPSVYTVRGVTSRDAFKELTKEQMTKVLCKARINVSHHEIDCAWEKAKEMDPEKKERVCFQSFREALAKVQKESLDNAGLTYETEISDCCPSVTKNCIPQPCHETKKSKNKNPCAGVDP